MGLVVWIDEKLWYIIAVLSETTRRVTFNKKQVAVLRESTWKINALEEVYILG